jgi:membrane protein
MRSLPRAAGPRSTKNPAMKTLWSWLKEIATAFMADGVLRHAAAIAFYTMFSLAPLLVIAVAVAGFVFGREAAVGAIVNEFQGLLGETAGEMIETIVARAAVEPSRGVVATVIGVVTLLVASIGVFGQLKAALNAIWGVTPIPGQGVWGFIRDRVLSFAVVLCIAFLLLVSLALSALISALGNWLGQGLSLTETLLHLVNFVISILVTTVLFGAMYKLLPDVRMSWRDVALGAFVTAALFSLGKFLIGLYLGRASIVGVYGAAGSLVMVLLWVYYSAVIFLVGAEFTQVYARRKGSKIMPSKRARWAPGESAGEADSPRRLAPA